MLTQKERARLAAMSDAELKIAMDKAERLKYWKAFWRYYFEIAVRSLQ